MVLRRWAFIGEGISHAGFGGVGTAWLASLAIPALGSETAAYIVAVGFCILMALAIGWVSRRERLNADAAIGIVLVASLAWGFVALSMYKELRAGRGLPAGTGWEFYLLGDIGRLSTREMLSSVAICAAIVLVTTGFSKEILSYTIDPELAAATGVPAGLIHYLLMLMLALVIVVGMRLAGYLLVTALLVLPGATALTISRRLGVVLTVAVAVSLVGTIGGLGLRAAFSSIPSGPAMVIVLFAQFVLAYGWRLVRR